MIDVYDCSSQPNADAAPCVPSKYEVRVVSKISRREGISLHIHVQPLTKPLFHTVPCHALNQRRIVFVNMPHVLYL